MRLKTIKLLAIAALTAPVLAVAMYSTSSQFTLAAPADDAAALFKAKCAVCHAADGSGNTPAGKSMKLRDLRSPEVQGQSDDQLYNITAKGKGKMAGYEKSLGADKCKELVRYIRSLKR